MRALDFRKTLLCSAIALASGAAVAQQPAADAKPDVEVVTVVAAPIKDSQQAALEAKQMADNYVDIISSDTIGRFPDQNLADSLGRLPGLAIERDQGQARYINFRGAPFRYTSIAFDGIDVPGADNGRVPRFDSFPSVITSRVEANKAILPNMPGESVAGFINIHTFSPFAQEGFSFAGDIGMGEQKLGGGDIDKFGLRGAWSNDHFGVVLFSSANSREQITDNREYDLERDDNGELVVNELDFRSYKIVREDSAHGGTFEFRGDGTLQRAFFSTLYSEFVDKEERNQFVFTFSEPVAGTTASDRAAAVSRMLEYGRYENSTFTNTLGADLQLGNWVVEGRYNLTETEATTYLPIPRSMGAATTADYDLSDTENPKLYLADDLNDLAYNMTLGILYGQSLEVDVDKFKLDAERDFEWFDLGATLEIGLQLDQREADGYVIGSPSVAPFPASINIDDFNTGRRWDAKTSNTIGGTYYNNKGLRKAWQQAGLGSIEPSPADLIVMDEDILALYAMTTTRFAWGNIVAGARIEQTDYTSEGTVDGEKIAVDDDFTNILPSVHVNIDLADDLKLRISGSTGVNRPTYDEWRAAASVDVANEEVRGGNPTLDAEEAIGIDTSLEWYFAPASIASVGAFYRQIDNVIYADSTTINGGIYVPSEQGQEWTYTGAVNGDNGEMSGIELNFIGHAVDLTQTLDGFGISANMTLLNSEFEELDGTKSDLPGTSDMIYNVSLFYENFGLSTRVNYQYRDEWVSPIEDPSEKWGEQKRVDLSVSYELPFDFDGARMSVYFNANNLTDETDVRYAGNGTINQSESYGRRYLLGARVNF
ncbi:TonB-dependent receptor [Spongiibacter nanhainus]|uniref:TonB-dependent receptor n=1 Tax=Spongiibacter nanhainus TaxID=2794344 RepID=A0A7T4R1B7_9GAMM|nr:TonB-dependent receptor [Spongiibacter nanhainus]QQD18626.1 TonB-dependent receptor [Spongiibacter nanhainus]